MSMTLKQHRNVGAIAVPKSKVDRERGRDRVTLV